MTSKPVLLPDETVNDSEVISSGLKCMSLDDGVLEPKTGFKFPTTIFVGKSQEDSSCVPQELAGVGFLGVTLLKLKTIKIYAYGFYIRRDCLRESHLSDKYGMIAPEELKLKPSFYEDILRQDLEMTVRLIVYYKGVKMGMVRSAFETSLRNRLKKIKGVNDDDGLQTFNSYFTGNLSVSQGTIINFRRLKGGYFQTEIDGHLLGTFNSHYFCQAFFDIYIGDPPVSTKAKEDIGEKIGHMLKISKHM